MVLFNACTNKETVYESLKTNLSEEYKLVLEDNNLILQHSKSQFLLANNIDISLTEEKPKMHILDKDNKQYILITIVWKTVKIGTTVSMWLYDCSLQTISEVFDGFEIVEYTSTTINDNSMLKIPQYNLSLEVIILSEYKNTYPIEGNIEFSKFVSYNIKSDSTVILERKIITGAIDWLGNKTLYTTFDIVEGILKPIDFKIQ